MNEKVAISDASKQTFCGCPECIEFGGPNPRIMFARLLIVAAQFMVATLGLVRQRSWKALLWLVEALAFFAFVPRKLICCRCEGYGKNCYSLCLGKITSLYLSKGSGEVNPLGAGLEVIALCIIGVTPAVGMRRNKKNLTLYLLLSITTLAFQFSHACRHCAMNATDWKKGCPAAMAARHVFA
ncbi:MAG: hypothetical protein PHP64_00015 [Actinomycetota bacterium]|nr:hypothetical protein [Actinomycetota bacterium]